MKKENIDYLGDGVYVEFDPYGVWLKANHHEHPTDRIYLDAQVYRNLIRFMENKGVFYTSKKGEENE